MPAPDEPRVGCCPVASPGAWLMTTGQVSDVRLPPRLGDRLAEGTERWAVIGATGWFGLCTLQLLRAALGREGFDQRVTCYASSARTLTVGRGHDVPVRALTELGSRSARATHVLHFAAITREQVGLLGLDAYVRRSLQISTEVHRAVAELQPEAFLYTSSGAVYGDRTDRALDTDLARNPYGTLKHLDELAFRQTCRDIGARCVVPRVFSVAGPHINKPEVYALADLLQQALTSDALRIRARHEVWRSYTDVRDVVAICLSGLLDEAQQELVFDTTGPRIEVGQLAEIVRTVMGRPQLPIERSLDPDAHADIYVGVGPFMEELARRYGVELADLEQQVRATAHHVRHAGHEDEEDRS